MKRTESTAMTPSVNEDLKVMAPRDRGTDKMFRQNEGTSGHRIQAAR